MQHRTWRWLFACCLGMSVGIGSLRAGDAAEIHSPAEYYVAPDGDDRHPGDRDRPFATLRRAKQAVRARIAAGLDRDLTVLVRGGDYFLEAPLVFGPEDSGDDQFAVTYAAYPGEQPRISGGRVIAGWEENDDGDWTVAIAEVKAGRWTFRELFVNGARRQRARSPDQGYYRVAQAGPDKRTSFQFRPGDIRDVADICGVELVFLHDWSTSRVPLKKVDEESHTVTLAAPIGPSAPHYRIDNFEPHPRYFLENSAAFLAAPGEWFLDAAGVLTYKPLPDETLETAEAIAPLAQQLLVVRGEAETGRPVKNLRFVGLTWRHCAWPPPPSGYAGRQAGFHEQRDGGAPSEQLPPAILFELAEACRFEDGRLEHLGGSGIAFGRSSRNCVFAGNVIADVAGNGVMIGEDRGRTVDGRSWWRVAPQQAASGNVVQNNLIERCGIVYFGAVGVWVGMANHTTIAHNVIRDLPYTGISVGWMWNPTPTPCHSNQVEHNHIHQVMQDLSDGAGIYTLGRQAGTVLRGNLIHDVPVNQGRAESNGMFLDEGAAELLIEQNLIFNIGRSPLRFHRAEENQVRDNRLYVRPGVPPVRYNATDPARIRLENNTVEESKRLEVRELDAVPEAGLEPAYRERLLGE